jgi:MSHA pilin protein MshD
MGVMSSLSARSGDAVVSTQATLIAKSYFDEVASLQYSDPDGDGEGSRSAFDDVDDYNGFSENGVHDRSGLAVPGLNAYRISISVTNINWGAPAVSVPTKQITVNVIDPLNRVTVISGYRTNHQ